MSDLISRERVSASSGLNYLDLLLFCATAVRVDKESYEAFTCIIIVNLVLSYAFCVSVAFVSCRTILCPIVNKDRSGQVWASASVVIRLHLSLN